MKFLAIFVTIFFISSVKSLAIEGNSLELANLDVETFENLPVDVDPKKPVDPDPKDPKEPPKEPKEPPKEPKEPKDPKKPIKVHKDSLYSIITQHPELSKFLELSNKYFGEDEVKKSLGGSSGKKLTLFVPTNDALQNLPQLTDKQARHLLEYHAVEDVIRYGDLGKGDLIDTLYHSKKLGHAQVIKVDKKEKTKLLNGKVIVGDLVNVEAKNGILHYLHAHLDLPGPIGEVLRNTPPQNWGPPKFNTLGQMLQRSGLKDLLEQNLTSVTVFAPTESAFFALGWKTLGYLQSEAGQPLLKAILRYHVVPKLIYSDKLEHHANRKGGEKLNTLEDKKIKLSATKHGHVLLNGEAKIDLEDVAFDRGVIHAIDKVLIPPDVKIPSGGWSIIEQE